MTEQRAQLGFIGLGQMGTAILERLETTGAELHIFDPNPAALGPFVSRGAIAHGSPSELAAVADITFSCLPTREICLQAAFGDDGVIHGGRTRIHVEMSTIGKVALEEISEKLGVKGIAVIDAPVSGGPKKARNGTLAVMAAGSSEAMARVASYLDLIGSKVYVVGQRPGQAQMMKLVNNLISAANMASAFEALVLGAKAGLDPDQMIEVINASTGRNSATVDKVPLSILPGTFDYGSRLAIMYKDVKIGLEEAEALDVPMWIGKSVGEIWRFAMTQGGGDKDFTTLIQYMEGWAGVTVRSRGKS